MSDEEWRVIAERFVDALEATPQAKARFVADRSWQSGQSWLRLITACTFNSLLAGIICFWLYRMEWRLTKAEKDRQEILQLQRDAADRDH